MLIRLEISPLQMWQLRTLINSNCPTIEVVLDALVAQAVAGVNRPESREGEWIRRAFPKCLWPLDYLHVAHATAWERRQSIDCDGRTNDGESSKWFGRVVRGDNTILFNSLAQATEQAALDLATQWLRDHPAYQPVEEALEEAEIDDARRDRVPDDEDHSA